MYVVVRNKPDRVASLQAAVADIKSLALSPQPVAARRRGRLRFAEGQPFARTAAVLMPTFRATASGKQSGTLLTQDMAAKLDLRLKYLARTVPRTIVAADTGPLLIILTDTSLEGEDNVSGLGAVCIDRANGAKFSFQMLQALEQLRNVHSETSKVINGREVLAVNAAIYA